MKKVIYSLVTICVLSASVTAETANPTLNNCPEVTVLAPQTSTTDIFNYLKTNLGLTSKQQPTVQTAVNEAGGKYLDLFKTASPGIKKDIEKAIFDEFTKKLGVSGLLSSTQSTKLSTLSPTLMSMFAQLK